MSSLFSTTSFLSPIITSSKSKKLRAPTGLDTVFISTLQEWRISPGALNVSLFHIPVLSGDPSTFIFSCPQYFSIIISCGKNYLSVVMITAFSLCLPRQERYSFEQLQFLLPLLRQFGIDNKRFFRDTPMNIITADVSGFWQPIFFLKCWEGRAYLLQIKNG